MFQIDNIKRLSLWIQVNGQTTFFCCMVVYLNHYETQPIVTQSITKRHVLRILPELVKPLGNKSCYYLHACCLMPDSPSLLLLLLNYPHIHTYILPSMSYVISLEFNKLLLCCGLNFRYLHSSVHEIYFPNIFVHKTFYSSYSVYQKMLL